jgi:hypothetical protein
LHSPITVTAVGARGVFVRFTNYPIDETFVLYLHLEFLVVDLLLIFPRLPTGASLLGCQDVVAMPEISE